MAAQTRSHVAGEPGTNKPLPVYALKHVGRTVRNTKHTCIGLIVSFDGYSLQGQCTRRDTENRVLEDEDSFKRFTRPFLN